MNDDGYPDSGLSYGYLSMLADHRSAVWCLREMMEPCRGWRRRIIIYPTRWPNAGFNRKPVGISH